MPIASIVFSHYNSRNLRMVLCHSMNAGSVVGTLKPYLICKRIWTFCTHREWGCKNFGWNFHYFLHFRTKQQEHIPCPVFYFLVSENMYHKCLNKYSLVQPVQLYKNTINLTLQLEFTQESIPVGCIPPACQPMVVVTWFSSDGHHILLAGGANSSCEWTYGDPQNRMTDRHPWKHYLPATSLADGKHKQNYGSIHTERKRKPAEIGMWMYHWNYGFLFAFV